MRSIPEADPGTPVLTSPLAFMRWRAGRQKAVLAGGVLFGVVGAAAQAALPFVVGRAIDAGLQEGLTRAILLWCLVICGIGALSMVVNSVGHRFDVHNWLRSALTTTQLLGHHATRTGSAITKELPTGEVVATVASDALRLGEIYAHVARFIGGLVAYVAVALILMRSSLTLGIAVLLGLPLVAAILALLVRPLHRKQSAQRTEAGRLTTLGADTVTGLRILRGIGGEDAFTARYAEQSQRVRAAGVDVARTQATLDALQVLLPGLFLAGVVWFGAHLALRGEITVGQLVTFYGYATFLTEPLRAATIAVQQGTRAYVGSRRIVNVLRTRHDVTDAGTAPAPEPAGVLEDTRSGIRTEPGRIVAVVGSDPDEAARLVTRMGRFDDDVADIRWGGTPIAEIGLAPTRERVVVAEATPALFSGTLAHELDVRGVAEADRLLAALAHADAGDVLDSMPEGLDGEIAEKGRSLSGGQRQRVALARALLTEAETLLLIEPTSAVDAHTEARVAANLREARAGRTTLVVTASPLVLERADTIVFVDRGVAVARGTHAELLERADRGEPAAEAYRAVVSRATGEGSDSTHVTIGDRR